MIFVHASIALHYLFNLDHTSKHVIQYNFVLLLGPE